MAETDSKREIFVDDDWKQRVKAEDAALDQQFRSQEQSQASKSGQTESAAKPGAQRLDPRMIPPADFPTLVGMFSTQAMVSLGLIPHPSGEKSEPQPELARHFIDLLGVVEEKTKGNLSPAENSLLVTTLHQLRMAYVELTKEPASSKGPSKT